MQSYFSTYMCLFNCQRKNKKIIYANVYRNTINDGDSQTSPLPIFFLREGGRLYTGYHALSHYFTINQVCHRTKKDQVQRHPGIPNGSQLRVRRDIFRVTRRLRGVAVAPEMYPVTCKGVVSLFRPIIVYKFLFPSYSGLKF